MSSASSVCNVRKEGLQHLSQQLHENRKQLCQFTSHDIGMKFLQQVNITYIHKSKLLLGVHGQNYTVQG